MRDRTGGTTMGAGGLRRWVLVPAVCSLLVSASAGATAQGGGGWRDRAEATAARARAASAYDTGFREGSRQGESDARAGRNADVNRHNDYRSAERGYDRSWGNRD